ncbi:unnamed protein product [Brassica rapa]|uniref:Zinc finger C3HC4 RING-type domain-containing protein n=2 Tax=Brassica TaxID=3705 RepID=A0A8D9I3Q8_BRACM|nr:unnamed protein product [Brassica napus]CAG7911041.1 unnamed protein product [Brassica rapa]CDY68822.1 BnaA10g29730D [Brassica napus]
MLSVALCGHQFCVECMKQYVEAMLLEGRVPRCPHYQCGSKPTLRSFASLLTPKLKKMTRFLYLTEFIAQIRYVASNVLNPFASTAKSHGIITCPAVITRVWFQILQQMT